MPLAWHPHVSCESEETLLLGSVPEMFAMALPEPLVLLSLLFLLDAMALLCLCAFWGLVASLLGTKNWNWVSRRIIKAMMNRLSSKLSVRASTSTSIRAGYLTRGGYVTLFILAT